MKPLDLAAWVAALLLASTLFAHTVALRLLLLLVGLGLVAAAIARDRRSLRLLPPLWIPLALWAAWAIASLAWSIDVERTAKELRNEIGYSIAVFWLCFVAAQARGSLRITLPIIALAAGLVSTLALQDFVAGGWYEYALGLHGGPGNHSSALVILLPCIAAATWCAQRERWPLWARIAGWSVLALLIASAYVTLNRTIWIALAMQAGVLMLFGYRRGAAAALRGKLVALAVTLALVLGAAVMVYAIQSERASAGTAGTMAADPRLALWSEAVEKIAQRPLTGYGFGRGLLRESMRAEFGKLELWHSHNLFLDTALQTGLPGLALLAALFGAALLRGWKLARGSDFAAAVCGAALIAVVLGTIVRNMTDVLWVRQNALLFWGTAGFLLSWGAQRRARGD